MRPHDSGRERVGLADEQPNGLGERRAGEARHPGSAVTGVGARDDRRSSPPPSAVTVEAVRLDGEDGHVLVTRTAADVRRQDGVDYRAR